MLEDVEDDVGLVSRILKREGLAFIIRQVDTRDDFMKALDTFDPDVILSDHALPQFNSIEAFKICQEKGLMAPFILVTGTVSEEFAVNILKQGADDYVLKSNLSRLPSAIAQALINLKSEKKKIEAETELMQENARLGKTNAELNSLVQGIAHRLRIPVKSSMKLLDLANAEARPNETLRKYLELIQSELNRLDNMFKNISIYSDNEVTKIAIEKIDFRSILNNCFDEYANHPAYQSLRAEINILSDLPFYSDADRLSNILRNIISNSIAFRKETEKETIILVNISVSNDSMVIEIEDNGTGIDHQSIPRVFEMFFRGHERSQEAGLGLFIANEIANTMGGNISIKSSDKSGTKVRISIPNKYSGHKD